MTKKLLKKVVGFVASIVTLSSSVQLPAFANETLPAPQLSPESTSEERPVLFIDPASNAAADYLIAAHRSHSSHRSHRSHYSSRGGSYSYPSTAPSTPSPSYNTEPSSSGRYNTSASLSLIREIQEGLVKLGYKVSVDGKFGPGTKNAISLFQADQGIAIDGQPTQNLLDKITEQVNKQ